MTPSRDDDVRTDQAPTEADAPGAALGRDGDDLDGLVTPDWAASRSGAERAGTPEALEEARREEEAPGPTEVRVASDEYLDVPPLHGITTSDRQI